MKRQTNPLLAKALTILAFCMVSGVASGLEASGTVTSIEGENSIFAFLGVFLLGLMLNLTPCVYPMLAITVTILGKADSGQRNSPFLKALVYVLGMATMYSSLGVIAALTGGLFGGLLQSPLLLTAIALLFLILSLSMFGLFELQPPAWLLNKIGATKTASFAGLFISGLFVGIFAAPCVGPPVIALLTVVGQRGEALYGFLVFFVLSMGLGLPYLILGSFSGLLNKLPRSGSWMIWIKKLLGILLLSLAIFYLSLAVNPRWSFTLIPATILIGGLYLGFISNRSGNTNKFRIVRYLTGAALIGISIYVWNVGQLTSVAWQDYNPEVQAVEGPYILYFSASWCIPCLELDRRTFTDPEVIAALSKIPAYKSDLTNYESESSQKLRKRYEIAGVPTLLFIDAEGNERKDLRVVGFVDGETFLETVKSLLEKTPGDGSDKSSPEARQIVPSAISLVSDSSAITPGQEFYLGIQFDMIDGWHVYWKNPGDSGTEPRIIWDLPEGFKIGEPEWPAPQMFLKAPFATFGHENYLLLPFKVRAPETLAVGEKLSIKADVSWLVCKEICIAQQGQVSLNIETADSSIFSDRADEFAQTLSALPSENDIFDIEATADNRSAQIKLTVKNGITDFTMPKSIQFFPSAQGVFRHGYTRIEATADGFKVQLVRTGLPIGDAIEGLVIFQQPNENKETILRISGNVKN